MHFPFFPRLQKTNMSIDQWSQWFANILGKKKKNWSQTVNEQFHENPAFFYYAMELKWIVTICNEKLETQEHEQMCVKSTCRNELLRLQCFILETGQQSTQSRFKPNLFCHQTVSLQCVYMNCRSWIWPGPIVLHLNFNPLTSEWENSEVFHPLRTKQVMETFGFPCVRKEIDHNRKFIQKLIWRSKPSVFIFQSLIALAVNIVQLLSQHTKPGAKMQTTPPAHILPQTSFKSLSASQWCVRNFFLKASFSKHLFFLSIFAVLVMCAWLLHEFLKSACLAFSPCIVHKW